jgi:hypothetical protein
MILFFTIIFIVWLVFCWKHIDRLGAGLIGMHKDRYGMFNVDVMIEAWLAVGLLFLFIWWLF